MSTVQQTQASSPPHEEETVEETDLGLEKVLGEASDEDTEKEQEGISELRREETVEADLLAELDPESVGEGEVVSHQPQQLSEPVTIEEDKLTTGVMATSLPREIPVLPPTPTEQREKPSSLTHSKTSHHLSHNSKTSPLPSLLSPLLARAEQPLTLPWTGVPQQNQIWLDLRLIPRVTFAEGHRQDHQNWIRA